MSDSNHIYKKKESLATRNTLHNTEQTKEQTAGAKKIYFKMFLGFGLMLVSAIGLFIWGVMIPMFKQKMTRINS